MEKKKWLWKRRSSEKSPGQSESSISFSSHSERYSDEQCLKISRESTNNNNNTQSQSVKSLTEKLSAALVNVSAKDDLVKQHAKVAEEAISGWEKAENEVAALKNALKECVRQLSQKQDEHEKEISVAINEKNNEWESIKIQLEKENSFLKQELKSKCTELEILSIESDKKIAKLEAEYKSKSKCTDLESLSIESDKKTAKLEAECKRLTSITDSRSDSNIETNVSELGCSGSWAPSLILELDQFKIEKPVSKNLVEIDLMDDFLEMEHVAALSETKSNYIMDNLLRDELDLMKSKVNELEKIKAEKVVIESALDKSRECLEAAERNSKEAENKLDELQREMDANADKMGAEIEKERKLSSELTAKCRELESKLKRAVQESVVQHKNTTSSNDEVKLKQEGLAVSADKLAECQKTIASLGMQLKSLATLEDFLIDTSSNNVSNDMFCNMVPERLSNDKSGYLENGSKCEEPQHPLPPLSTKSKNKSKSGFGKLFSRSRSMRFLNYPD